MAETFTGLKLQGAIGKFGQIELSDIGAYVELPDGKVLSGTETGALLMWDGNFIQYEVLRAGGQLCHKGVIEFIALEDRELITAGHDGYVRRWSFDQLEFMEVGEDSTSVELEPMQEVFIGENVKIVGMLRGEDHWVVQDSNGGLFKLWVPSYEVERLLSVHAGAITGCETSPSSYTAMTCGVDGTLRVWDIAKGEAICTKTFGSAARCMSWAPAAVDSERRTVLVGFDDGCVRVVKRFSQSLQLHYAFKPHNKPVTQLAVSPDGAMLATGSADGTVFFLQILDGGSNFIPLGFVSLGAEPKSLHWSQDSRCVLLAVGGEVVELSRPDASEYLGKDASRTTYAIEVKSRRVTPQVPILKTVVVEPEPAEDEELPEEIPDEEKDTKIIEEIDENRVEEISAVLYGQRPGTFYVSLDGDKRPKQDDQPDERYATLYICSFNQTEPSQKLFCGEHWGTVSSLAYSDSQKYLMIGARNGAAQVRPLADPEFFLMTTSHDGAAGKVTRVCTSFDDRFLVTTGEDGNFFVSVIDPETALQKLDRAAQAKVAELVAARKRIAMPKSKRKKYDADGNEILPEPEEVIDPRLEEFVSKVLRPGEVTAAVHSPAAIEETLEAQLDTNDVADLLDPTMYSIEDAKQKQEEDDRMDAAEKKKQLVRLEVEELRKEFQFLLKKNESLEASQRLPREAFDLDPKLKEQLEKDAQEKIDMVHKELAWISEKHDLALRKLRSKFLDNLIVEHIRMSSFRTDISVSCFRTPELPPFLRDAIKHVHDMIDAEEKNRREKEATGGLGLREDKDDGLGTARSAKGKGGRKPTTSNKGKSVRSRGGQGTGASRNAGVSEAELRKQARDERKKQLEKLKASKPDKNVDDPMDVAAVQYAERNMGDYKLKSDPNYVVPENQRVNAERKRRQMVLLQESVHFIKMGFNERFLVITPHRIHVCVLL